MGRLQVAGAMGLRVGVLAVQGAVSEHEDALRRAAADLGLDVEVLSVRDRAQLDRVDGLVLPGGESTTISRLLRSGDLHDELVGRAKRGDLAVFGTCAGLVLLADRATRNVEEKGVRQLGLLEATVDRNAFGRQRDSFESDLEMTDVGRIPAVFIRAPVLTELRGDAQELARTSRGIVAARQGRVLGTAFHPELTPDARVHGLFLRMVEAARRGPVTADGTCQEEAKA